MSGRTGGARRWRLMKSAAPAPREADRIVLHEKLAPGGCLAAMAQKSALGGSDLVCGVPYVTGDRRHWGIIGFLTPEG